MEEKKVKKGKEEKELVELVIRIFGYETNYVPGFIGRNGSEKNNLAEHKRDGENKEDFFEKMLMMELNKTTKNSSQTSAPNIMNNELVKKEEQIMTLLTLIREQTNLGELELTTYETEVRTGLNIEPFADIFLYYGSGGEYMRYERINPENYQEFGEINISYAPRMPWHHSER